MAEKLINNTGLSEFATKIKESVPLVGTTTYTSGNISLDSIGSYSLNEIETPFTWIDGKKIFKKTVDCGSLPSNATKDIETGIVAEQFIKIEGIRKVTISSVDYYISLPAGSLINECTIEASVVDNKVRLATGRTWETPNQVYVTVYYTKS